MWHPVAFRRIPSTFHTMENTCHVSRWIFVGVVFVSTFDENVNIREHIRFTRQHKAAYRRVVYKFQTVFAPSTI